VPLLVFYVIRGKRVGLISLFLFGAQTNKHNIIHSIFSYRFQLYLDIQGEQNHIVNYILVEIHITVKYTNTYVLEITTKYIIQINQPTRCKSFTSILLDVHVWLNMFWVSPRPSSGAYNCTRSLWFYIWKKTAPANMGSG
jgi:hypothetical protein